MSSRAVREYCLGKSAEVCLIHDKAYKESHKDTHTTVVGGGYSHAPKPPWYESPCQTFGLLFTSNQRYPDDVGLSVWLIGELDSGWDLGEVIIDEKINMIWVCVLERGASRVQKEAMSLECKTRGE